MGKALGQAAAGGWGGPQDAGAQSTAGNGESFASSHAHTSIYRPASHAIGKRANVMRS